LYFKEDGALILLARLPAFGGKFGGGKAHLRRDFGGKRAPLESCFSNAKALAGRQNEF